MLEDVFGAIVDGSAQILSRCIDSLCREIAAHHGLELLSQDCGGDAWAATGIMSNLEGAPFSSVEVIDALKQLR